MHIHQIYIHVFSSFSASFNHKGVNAECCRGFANDFSSYEE